VLRNLFELLIIRGFDVVMRRGAERNAFLYMMVDKGMTDGDYRRIDIGKLVLVQTGPSKELDVE